MPANNKTKKSNDEFVKKLCDLADDIDADLSDLEYEQSLLRRDFYNLVAQLEKLQVETSRVQSLTS